MAAQTKPRKRGRDTPVKAITKPAWYSRYVTVANMRFLPYTAILVAVTVFYRAILFRANAFIPWDLPGYHLPQAVFASACLRRGILPLWDPGMYCGRPFYAEIQTQIFYPFRLVTMLLAGPLSHVRMLRAMEIEQVFHVFLSGVFTLLLARHVGMRPPAALLSATGYSLGCYFASQAEHIGAIETATWLPLVWLSIFLLADRLTFARFGLLSVSFALMLLSGFTPSAIAFFLSSILLALLLPILRISNWRLLAVTIGAMAASMLLTAIQVLPTRELSGLSAGGSRAEWRGTGGGLPLLAFVSLVRPNYLHTFDPANLDSIHYDLTLVYFYCGGVVLACALVGIFTRFTRRKLALIVMLCVAAIWMVGDQTPIGKWLFLSLPGLVRGAMYPHHWLAVFSLCMALLAGSGLDRFSGLRGWAFAVVILSAADLIAVGSSRPMNTSFQDPRSVGLDEALDGERQALAQLRRATADSPQPPGRLDIYNDTPVWLAAESLTGIPVANGYDPLALTRLIKARLGPAAGASWHYNPVRNIAAPMLKFMNVRYMLSRTPIDAKEVASSPFHLGATFPGRYVYEDSHPLPRFLFASQTTAVPSEQEAIKAVQRKDWNPAEEVFVEGLASSVSSLSPGKVNVLEYSPNLVRLQTSSAGAGFLVSSEANYPGWKAEVDGVEVPIYYSNVAFRGIQVPAGEHRITFEFRPAIFKYSAWTSLATAMVFGVVLISRRRTNL